MTTPRTYPPKIMGDDWNDLVNYTLGLQPAGTYVSATDAGLSVPAKTGNDGKVLGLSSGALAWVGGSTGALVYKGTIAVASSFPTTATVQTGWYYRITADVVDNDATKTNTGQVFYTGDEIVWNGASWDVLGNSATEQSEINDKASAACVYFDSNTLATSKIVHTLSSSNNISTQDFSVWTRISIPASKATTNGIFGISSSSTSYAVAYGLGCWFDTNGCLNIRLYGSSTSNYKIFTSTADVVTTKSGKICDLVIVRNAATPSMVVYLDGAVLAGSDSSAGTPPTWAGSITSTYAMLGNLASTFAFNARMYRFVLFNRVLTQADSEYLSEKNVMFVDNRGQIDGIVDVSPATLNGGFETLSGNANLFTNWAVTLAGSSTVSIDTTHQRTGTYCASLNIDGSNSNAHVAQTILTVGKKYRVSFWAYASSIANAPTMKVSGTATYSSFTLTGTYAQYSVDITADSTTIAFKNNANCQSISIYIDDIRIVPIGAFLDSDISDANTNVSTTVGDCSGNGYTGTITGAVTVNPSNYFASDKISWTDAQKPEGGDLTLGNSGINSTLNDRSNSGAVYFDGNILASARIYHTLGGNIGTKDFTVWTRVRMPSTAVASTSYLLALSSANNSVAGYGALFCMYNGYIGMYLYGATTADYRLILETDASLTRYAGKIVDIIVVRDSTASTMKLYINGQLRTVNESTGGTPPAWSGSVTSTYALIGGGSAATQAWKERIYRAVVYNRALPTSEIYQIRESNVHYSNMWGSWTDIVNPTTPTANGDFETRGTNGGTKSGVMTATRACASNVATITTPVAHGFSTGNSAIISGMTDATYNGTKTVTVVDTTTFTYALTHADEAQTADTAGTLDTVLFTGWSSSVAGAAGVFSTVNVETSAPYAGTYSIRMDMDASHHKCYATRTNVCVIGKRYKISCYAKANVNGVILTIGSSSGGAVSYQPVTTSYALYTAEFVASNTGLLIGPQEISGNNSTSLYVDNVTLIEVGAVLDSDLEDYDPAQGTFVFDRSSNNQAGTATATGLTQVKNYNSPRTTSINASGTVYTITATPAKVTFGTTSPSITISSPGTYLLIPKMRVDLSGATFAANRTVTAYLYRNNNTPTTLTNSTVAAVTPVVTTQTQTLLSGFMNPVIYTTANSTDIIDTFISIDVVPSAGSITVSDCEIVAVRLF